MSEKSWWDDAAEYVGEATPATLAEMLEQQMLLQMMKGDQGPVLVPRKFARLIAEVLRRAPASKSAPRRTWRENRGYDLVIEKGKRQIDDLVAGGLKYSAAYEQVAEEVHAVPEFSHLTVATIKRDLQRKDDGRPFRR